MFVGLGNWLGEGWHDYINMGGLRRENRQLREQNEKLRIEQSQLSEEAAQAHRLQALLDFKQHFIAQTVAAQVIGSSGTEQSRILYIDRGAKDGIRSDMAVITPDGVVGKVRDVFSGTAQVLLLNDTTSGVGALLEQSRLHGVVKGTATGDVLLDHVMVDEKVEPGERVLTSGGDRVYPKGLPIGTVAQVLPGSDLFLNIRIRPAADLHRLEEVLVVTQPQVAQAETETPVRAADILAQRLPGVNKKPENASGTQGAGTANTVPKRPPAQGKIQVPTKTPPSTPGTDTKTQAPVKTAPQKPLLSVTPPPTPEATKPQ